MAIMEAREALKTMLTKCAALQGWGYTEVQLQDRIHFDALPDPANGVSHTAEEYKAFRPFVIVGVNATNPLTIKRDGVGGGLGTWGLSGSMMIAVDQAVNESSSEQENEEDFQSRIDALISTGNPATPGLVELIDQAGSLAINEIAIEGFFRVLPEEVVSKGDAQRAYIRIDWGVK